MYLSCPSGLLDVIYSAFANNEYKSIYWTEKDKTMIMKYVWDGTTYIYSEKKVGFKKEVKFTMMTKAKTFEFQVLEMERMVDLKTHITEMLTFNIIELNEKVSGTFFLYRLDLEEEIYNMNHLSKSEMLQ